MLMGLGSLEPRLNLGLKVVQGDLRENRGFDYLKFAPS